MDPRINTIDRDLLEAERDAEAGISPNREDDRVFEPLSSPGLSGTTTRTVRSRRQSSALEDVELNRIFTYRLQHKSTVGSTRGATPREQWLPLGAGKPYPPALPDAEEYVVEFVGPHDPLHPHNWPLRKK